MQKFNLLLCVFLAACGGGDDQGPTICGKNYCDDQGHIVFVEHFSTNDEHIKQGRAVAEVDGIVYTNYVPLGKPNEYSSVCEYSVGEFVAGTC